MPKVQKKDLLIENKKLQRELRLFKFRYNRLSSEFIIYKADIDLQTRRYSNLMDQMDMI